MFRSPESPATDADRYCAEHRVPAVDCADQRHPWDEPTNEPDFVPSPAWLERDPFVERRD